MSTLKWSEKAALFFAYDFVGPAQYILFNACRRLYILRVSKFYSLPKDQLHLLFICLILSIFTVWCRSLGSAYYDKCLSRVDKVLRRAFKLAIGCCKEFLFSFQNILAKKDKKLRDRITDKSCATALDDFLPPENFFRIPQFYFFRG